MFDQMIEILRKTKGAFGGLAIGAAMLATASAVMAGDQPAIKMAINQSPWLDSFVAIVDKYEKDTGNKIELDVSPYSGLLEKVRNSVRGKKGEFDLLNINSLWLPELYSGGFLVPLAELSNGYTLQEGVLTYGDTVSWDVKNGTFSAKGDLMGVPLNGNVQVLYYNTEIYDALGLKEPKTWTELQANAEAIQKKGDAYGFVTRSGRKSIVYNFTPYLFSHGGSFFSVGAGGVVNITINSAEGKAALDTYVGLATKAGPPSPGAVEQGDLIQLLSTGRAGQAIAVIGAWGGLENPQKSAVVGKINAALIPADAGGSASSAGHWVAGIPKNISSEQQNAVLAFLTWFQSKDVQSAYVKAGGVPIRGDLGGGELASDKTYRFIDAYSANAANAVMGLPVAQASEISSAIALHFNRAVIGEMTTSEALNAAAESIATIMEREGHKVIRGTDL